MSAGPAERALEHSCVECEGAPHTAAAAEEPESQSYQDCLTCAICLDHIAPADIAAVPECGHQYCVNCILFWATRKEAAWCPQCRVKFSQLTLYRKLDGEPRELPGQESLCLLKRTAWFQDYAQAREQGRNPAVPRLLSAHDAAGPSGYEDLLEYQDYDRYFQEFDQDDEVEAYYMSAAAGTARITLGNRRWGENGYVSSGRMRARPVAPVHSKAQKGKAASKAAGKPAAKPGASSSGQPSSSAGRPAGAGSSGPVSIPGSGKGKGKGKPKGPPAPVPGGDWDDDLSGTSPGGRRARRNARRAALDEAGGSPC